MRPIDADSLKYRRKDYGGYDDVPDEERKRGILFLLKEDIDAAPTIDTVKHGQWIKMSDRDGIYWACSECGEDLLRFSHYTEFDLLPRLKSIDRTNYCPNCGARMDLK